MWKFVGKLGTIAFVVAAMAGAAHADDEQDPLATSNRKVFWFNDQLDIYVLEPAGRGWDYVVPDRAQQCVSDFFLNIRFPVVAINNLLQGKFVPAASDVGRFVLNTTVGLAGLFDPATEVGLRRHDEDFGQTLGVWGVGQGPYLTVPFLGPLTIRDGFGYLVDIPLAVYPIFLGFEVTVPARAVDTVNWRASLLEPVVNAKEASLDYYVFVRDAYLQRREALVTDSRDDGSTTVDEDDLYFEEADEE